MKNLLLSLSIALCGAANAQNVNIPDPALKTMLLLHADDNADGEIQVTEATEFEDALFISYSVTQPNVIQDLTGVEAFINATALYCADQDVSILDVSNNTKLKAITINNSELTTLDLSNNPLLERVDVDNNNLTSLDLSQCPLLNDLLCNTNQLETLNISNNPLLERVWCSDNSIASLNVSSCLALKELNCIANAITNLNVTGNTMLERLWCNSNLIPSIDVTSNAALLWLDCGSNNFTELDVSNNALLQQLNCANSLLTSLDLTNNPDLFDLAVYGNQLTEINVGGAPGLLYFNCSNNLLTDLDVSGNEELIALHIGENQLVSVDVSNNPDLARLSCTNNSNMTYINAKNGNNHNMELFPVDFEFLAALETVCLDDADSDFAGDLTAQVGSGVTLTDVCTMDTDNHTLYAFMVYPNPVKDFLSIQSDTPVTAIEVHNSLGQLMLSAADTTNINLSGLSNGIYLINISDATGRTTTKRIMKQ